MISFFSNIFGYILNWIYFLVKNYAWAIIIFSVLIKVLMLPLSIKQQRTLKKNEKIQEEMKILQIKHKGDTEKINKEMMEIYKREKISPFSGCLSVILQFILLLAMFTIVRSPLTYMKQIDDTVIKEKIEQIKEEKGAESISKTYPEMSIIKYVQEDEETDSELFINMNFFGLDLSKIPQENLSDWKVYIIPVLYVVSSIISIKITSNATKKKEENTGKNEESLATKEDTNKMDTEEMTTQMNKSMSLMVPILSVSVSFVAPLGLALYWLVNNIIMIIERVVLNQVFSKEEEENA